MTATVSLESVSKTYTEGTEQRSVLSGLNLQAFSGETVALLGASGSGKSTLLNLISGLIVPDSGKVQIAGCDLARLSSKERTLFRRRNIGFVFQFFHLVPTLTVEENLRLPLQLNQLDNTDGARRIQELLDRVGLLDRRSAFPDRLSGGEQQRVAVCRALVHRPPLLLADEPTGNLDSHTAGEVLKLLLELAKAGKATLMIVTHSDTVASACERTARLQDGRLTEGAPAP